jgi:hypothetical protein
MATCESLNVPAIIKTRARISSFSPFYSYMSFIGFIIDNAHLSVLTGVSNAPKLFISSPSCDTYISSEYLFNIVSTDP